MVKVFFLSKTMTMVLKNLKMITCKILDSVGCSIVKDPDDLELFEKWKQILYTPHVIPDVSGVSG
jgi:hypothetical protein